MGIIIILLLITAPPILVYKLSNFDPWGNAVPTAIVNCVFVVLLSPTIFGWTGGLFPEYSTGVRDGYINKLSARGVFVKTNEGELQIGSGNLAAVQEPFEFAIVDPDLVTQADRAARGGDRVRLHYRQYLMPNWFEGSARSIVIKVENLE